MHYFGFCIIEKIMAFSLKQKIGGVTEITQKIQLRKHVYNSWSNFKGERNSSGLLRSVTKVAGTVAAAFKIGQTSAKAIIREKCSENHNDFTYVLKTLRKLRSKLSAKTYIKSFYANAIQQCITNIVEERNLLPRKWTQSASSSILSFCHFNPIEIVWVQIKAHVADSNKNFKLKDVEELVCNNLENVTPTKWKSVFGYTLCILKESWDREGMLEQRVEELIIRLGNNGSSSQEEGEKEEELRMNCHWIDYEWEETVYIKLVVPVHYYKMHRYEIQLNQYYISMTYFIVSLYFGRCELDLNLISVLP